MQIAQVIGGYTLGAADLLRRAMGKKKPEEMAQAARHLRRAAPRRTASRGRRRSQLFDLMEKFAGYGFNKSHSAAYALVAYQTAYFKAHHAARVHGGEPVARHGRHRQGARASTTMRVAQGLAILPPDVNASRYRFEPVDATQHPLWPGRHQGHGRGGDRGDRRRARRRRPVHRPLRFLPPRRQAHRQPPRRRGAGARRRVRRDRRAPRDAVRLRRRLRSTPASAQRPRRRRSRCSAKSRGAQIAATLSRRANGPTPSA